MTPNTSYFETDIEDNWNDCADVLTIDNVIRAWAKMGKYKAMPKKYVLYPDPLYKIGEDGKVYIREAYIGWFDK